MFISKKELDAIRTFMDFLRVHLELNKTTKYLSENEKFHAQWEQMLRPAQSRLKKIEVQQEIQQNVISNTGSRVARLESFVEDDKRQRSEHMKRHNDLDGEMRIMIARMDKRKKNVSELYRRLAELEKKFLESERINQDIHERVNGAIGDFAEHCCKPPAKRKA